MASTSEVSVVTRSEETAGISWEHPDYVKTKESVRRMRVSIQGEDEVKRAGYELLPHPCQDPKKWAEPEQVTRYDAFRKFAEYDNVPGNTLEALIGGMFRVEPVQELQSSLEYLSFDADGNGMPLDASLELTASECLQMRYHGLLAEYADLAGEDLTSLTVEQAQRLNLRAYIKHYTREAIVDWSYKVVNGAKQLNMVVLREAELQVKDINQRDSEGFSHKGLLSYLVLALDDEGKYFQRRYTELGGEGNESEWSEMIYPQANGQTLDFIPFEIVFSSERKVGDIPKQLGYLDPISKKAVHRYQVSALLKESLRITAQPTSYSSGWTQNSFTIYKEMTGRNQIHLGAGEHIPIPEGAEIGYLTWNADQNGMFKYMEGNKSEIIALGGLFDDETDDTATATGRVINSAEKKGVLSTLAKNIEQSYARVFSWCTLFETGQLNTDSEVKLTRDFVAITLTPQERGQIMNEFLNNIISREETFRQLTKGGVLEAEANQILDELENSPNGVV